MHETHKRLKFENIFEAQRRGVSVEVNSNQYTHEEVVKLIKTWNDNKKRNLRLLFPNCRIEYSKKKIILN